MSKEKKRSDRPPPGELAVALWVLIPIIIFGAYVMQIFESFSAVGCEGDCDLELALGGRAAYPWEVGASVVIAIALALVLRFRGKPPHWAPLVGVALVVGSAIVTSILFQIGLAPMHERNDRIARGEAPAETPPPLPDPVGRWEADDDDTLYLELASDGTVVGNDGCNDLTGRWTQDADGEIDLDTTVTTTDVCPDVDTWLGRGRSADIIEDYMYVNGKAGSAIGGLEPVR
ncbi:META domain-containing protein [Microbacterium sp. EST19A]|uniref:META domain-containing protein n=1 Tax=Microbacterium sp. EST19A TaxID=2862681 RepID=UPI001CC0498C|nr:META domain-containing protein [Microbacterium sp. EST19A]